MTTPKVTQANTQPTESHPMTLNGRLRTIQDFLKRATEVRTSRPLNQEAGFSLIEILIVIAIMALLGTLVGSNLLSKFDEAKVGLAKTQIKNLGNELDNYKRVCGVYPSSNQNLDALITPQADCKNYPSDGFLKDKKIPKDPWDNDYFYESDGNKYVIKSYGSDKKPGGENFAKDISSDD
jgi:general secretion pathway protein G